MEKGEAKMGLRKRLWVMVAAAMLLGGAVAASQQTAMASTAQTAMASTATHVNSPTGQRIPNISFAECSGIFYRTWVHLDIYYGLSLQDWCFGFTGTWQFTQTNNVVTFCSGNNIGVYHYFYTTDPRRVIHYFNYRPGQIYNFAANVRIYSLTIQGWSGSDTCPLT
jgi:hypothetical protein